MTGDRRQVGDLLLRNTLETGSGRLHHFATQRRQAFADAKIVVAAPWLLSDRCLPLTFFFETDITLIDARKREP